MEKPIQTSFSIPKMLFDQTKILAQHLNISHHDLVEMAIEKFATDAYSQTIQDSSAKQLEVNQGDIFWIQLAIPNGTEPSIPHPHVIIQDNVFNHSRIKTVVACGLTSNIKRANNPGNVLLEVAEANLTRQSVVEVAKVSTVDKAQLGDYIGSLTEKRVDQILDGMRFLQRSFFER